jgi:type III secretory pathway lipoprotein EscJ
MMARRRSRRLTLPALLAVCLLAACGKTELYSGLSERDANEMLALLMRSGIATDKVASLLGNGALGWLMWRRGERRLAPVATTT